MATKAQAAGYGYSITGAKELINLFDQLPTVSMKKTVLRNALKKAGGPIVDAAKASCPVVTGNLKESIMVSRKLKDSQKHGPNDRTSVTVYVGSTAPHAHLVEFGTVERTLKKPRVVTLKNGNTVTITKTGKMSPTPFLRNAWDATKHKALKIFGEQIWTEISKSARRLAKRAEQGKLTKAMIRGLSK